MTATQSLCKEKLWLHNYDWNLDIWLDNKFRHWILKQLIFMESWAQDSIQSIRFFLDIHIECNDQIVKCLVVIIKTLLLLTLLLYTRQYTSWAQSLYWFRASVKSDFRWSHSLCSSVICNINNLFSFINCCHFTSLLVQYLNPK